MASAIDNDSESVSNIDESKVNIAVRFLCNPNVQDTSRDRQVKFLHAKGLNNDEIELALKRSKEHLVNNPDIESSAWSFWDYFKGIVLGAGILSSANYAYKAYFLPYIAHEIKDDQRIELLKESVELLKDDLKQKTYEFTCTLKSIQSLLEEEKQLLANIEAKLGNDGTSASSLDSIKSDLTALKSMMLSKDRFPSVPFATGSVEIPAWQKASSEQVDQNNKDEKLEEQVAEKEVEEDEGVEDET